MRIALLTWNYPPKRAGGTGIATQNIARHLTNRGHQVLVITTRDAGLPEESMEEGFCVHRVRSLKPKLLKYGYFCFKVLLILRGFRPDITHAQAMWTGLPALVTKTVIGKPYLVWGRGSDVYYPRLFKGSLSKLVLSKADAVVALTHDMKKEMLKVCKRDILVIGNGVDSERFGSHSRKEARYQLGIREDEKVVIFVGTLVPVKGVRYLIEAMNIIKQERPETRLLIVGDGPEKEKLQSLASQLGVEDNITFTKRVNNSKVAVYLAASDMFVLPTLSEGYPNTIAEAMASGLPIVSTSVRGLSEIIADGRNGFIVTPRNPTELAKKILLTLRSDVLRGEISTNNRAWAKLHTWEKVVGRLMEAYSKVVCSIALTLYR